MIDLDNVLDYKAIYSGHVKKVQVTGSKLLGLCPFHPDKNASFSADLKTGQFQCFACGKAGNFLTFYAELNGVDTKEAYKRICEEHGLSEQRKQPCGNPIEAYAEAKHLPADWLKAEWKMSNGKDTKGAFVKIPYLTKDGGKVSATRKRYVDEKAFAWVRGGKLTLYGLHWIDTIHKMHKVVLVEGESDTQSLMKVGIPALGVPGASTFKVEWVKHLEGLTVYIHVEPDTGGETFFRKVCQRLAEAEFSGEVYKVKIGGAFKDPSDVLIAKGEDELKRIMHERLKRAERVDIAHLGEDITQAVPGFSVALVAPDGWQYAEKGGIMHANKDGQMESICRTPLIISKRLGNIETGEEKVVIEYKRDGKVEHATLARSVVFQARSITVLSDFGITITSENAKPMVQYLGALEAENYERIPRFEASDRMGWLPGKRFLPCSADGVEVDTSEPSLLAKVAAYEPAGDFDKWKAVIGEHRAKSYRVRAMLSASFAAPLIKLLKQRIFFVYCWADSRGGKTAALKAALSVWGSPEDLMTNFNATQVAIERTAWFFCDLPFGLDERQLAGGSTKEQQLEVDRLIYMLGDGKGKNRGSKGGGLQDLHTWRTVVLSTGEEPLVNESSKTGVSSRIIELYGAPFESETEASYMHQMVEDHHGHAGKVFIDHIIENGIDDIREVFEEVSERLRESGTFTNGAHAASISVIAAADYLSSVLIFGIDAEEARTQAHELAARLMKEQNDLKVGSVNERAVSFITDWVAANRNNFSEKRFTKSGITEAGHWEWTPVTGKWFGAIRDDDVAVVPSVLRQDMERAGFSYQKTVRYMAENGMIRGEKGRTTNNVRIDGKLNRVLLLGEWAKPIGVDAKQTDPEGFGEVDDDELPFSD